MENKNDIIKTIQESDNPIKTAIDIGCVVKHRNPTEFEKKNRIITLYFILPAPIRELDIKFNFNQERNKI